MFPNIKVHFTFPYLFMLGLTKEECMRPKGIRNYKFVTSASRGAETKMASAGQSRGSRIFKSLNNWSTGNWVTTGNWVRQFTGH